MVKKFKMLICFILNVTCIFLFTGCWDSKDIEKRNIITALIVDKKYNEYFFYTEMAKVSEQSQKGDGSSNFKLLISKGSSFNKARDEIDRKSVKELFLGAVRILVFTDGICKDGIEEYINRLRGQIEYRKSILLATTDGEPKEILSIKPESTNSVGFAIESELATLTQNGTSFSTDIGDVIEVMAVKKAGFLLPFISIRDRKLILSGYSVFKDQKKIGKISADDRKGVVYLLNNNSDFYYDIYVGNKKYTVNLKLKSKNIKPQYTNKKLEFNLSMKFNTIINMADKIEPISKNDYAAIKNQAQYLVRRDIERAVETSQNDYKCDYLNFYKYYKIYYLKEFEKSDWNEIYSSSKVIVNTSVNIAESNIPLN